MNQIDIPKVHFGPTAVLKFPFANDDEWKWDGKVLTKSVALMAANRSKSGAPSRKV